MSTPEKRPNNYQPDYRRNIFGNGGKMPEVPGAIGEWRYDITHNDYVPIAPAGLNQEKAEMQ